MIARWHDATDLELERFKTRDGVLKEGSCRRKTERIGYSKDVQVQRRPGGESGHRTS